MATRPVDEHPCGWHDYAEYLEAKIAPLAAHVETLNAELETLKRHVFGKRSEKMPPMDGEVKKKPSREQTQAKRAESAEAKAKLVTESIPHNVPEEKRTCPACDKQATPAGTKESIELDYVQGHFRRRSHVRETLSCSCGEYIVTADAPDRVFDKTLYTPAFVAHIIVQKCADSIPLYRLEKQFRRLQIPMARSTMTDLFHRAAMLLEPLVERIAVRVRESDLVLADETSQRMQKSSKKAFLWTFIAGRLVLYRFAVDRSGKTPEAVLGDSKGILVVDGYSGYNIVTTPEGRERAGCLAHARRKFFDAKDHAPKEAEFAKNLIRRIYVVEHDAKERNIAGTKEHLRLRQTDTTNLMVEFRAWLTKEEPNHLPKGPMAQAIHYALNNWEELTLFLRDARIPPDNNRSESALRVPAMGRKAFLFVHDEKNGKNLANLYTLVATCEACGVEPTAYLTDVLMRISTHPNAAIDELLPDRWRPRD